MLEELTKSLKAILYERVVSPLSGAFIFSWCIINWKVFVYLFMGNETPSGRIANIESLSYMALSWEGFFHLFIFPSVSALLFIFAYPYPSKWAYSFAKERTEELIRIKQNKERKRLLTEEDADELRVQMERTKHEVAIMIKEKDAMIEALNNKLKRYEMANNAAADFNTGWNSNDGVRNEEKSPEGSQNKLTNSGKINEYNREYVTLRRTDFFKGFENIIMDVYQNNGRNLTSEEKQKYHLANFISPKLGGGFEFTEKGRRMAHLFQAKL